MPLKAVIFLLTFCTLAELHVHSLNNPFKSKNKDTKKRAGSPSCGTCFDKDKESESLGFYAIMYQIDSEDSVIIRFTSNNHKNPMCLLYLKQFKF